MEAMEQLFRTDNVTYQQLAKLYRQCKDALDEFYEVFQRKSEDSKDLDTFLSLTELKEISKEIQALSNRVIELEGKIESVSRMFATRAKTEHIAYSDRKLLPQEKMLLEGGQVKRGRLLGGGGSRGRSKSKKKTNALKTKEVTCSNNSEPVDDNGGVEPINLGRQECEGSVRSTCPGEDNATDSYEKVYKLIPELLAKFEEFHRSFVEACDSEKNIESTTAADILKAMDDHLKLLERLERRLSDKRGK